jgi:flavin-dependent dehydrogenase
LNRIHVIGGGPAGSTAALAASLLGSTVQLVEKSKLPRHKVCGEFLSPEIIPVLDRLGVLDSFLDRKPARIHRMQLHFGAKCKISRLPEPAYGLSRFEYDHLLLNSAKAAGAKVITELEGESAKLIQASGRRTNNAGAHGKRIFGFKAHFTGPAADAVELYFFRGCYVGISCVEGGITNVCGLGPEHILRQFNFEIDELVQSCPALAARLAPLSRSMKWLNIGPLVFQNSFDTESTLGVYPAGDALSFVDPFTGSGLLSAAITGELAGTHAAQGLPSAAYLNACRKALSKPFGMSTIFRAIARTSWAEHLAGFVPGEWLYRLTRPRAVE